MKNLLQTPRDKARKLLSWTSRKAPRLARLLGFARRKRRPLWTLFRLFMHVLGLVCSFQAVLSTRTSQGTIAWAISLNTIPVVAVPAWWAFGDSGLDNYAAAQLVGLAKVRPVARQMIESLQVSEVEIVEEGSLMATLAAISSLPVTSGNQVELLTDGKNTFDSIYDAIDNAKDYILVQFYIIRDDEAGGELKDHLVKKAGEGIRVYVIYDDYGSLGLEGKFTKDLRDAGAHVTSFMNFDKEPNRFQINFRNHRKLVVIDGKTAFVGGHNVGSEYLGAHPVLTPWRDSHMRISGPVVTCLQVPFMEDWHWATGETIQDLQWSLEAAAEASGGSALAVGIPSGPADPMETCSLFFHACIHAAQKRIWIATPYFVPDEALILSLQLAAARGVEIKILIPDLGDSKLIRLSSFSYLEELGKAGIEVWRYEKGFLHQKALLVDDHFASLGSANMDNRSLRLNFELMVGVQDEKFAGEVEKMLEEDFSNSRLTSGDDLDQKSLLYKLSVRVARLLAPIQ
jgi:cardiolipin synthase A/B